MNIYYSKFNIKEGDNDILFMATTSLILVGLVGNLIPLPLSHFLWTLLFGSLLGGLSHYQVQALNHRITLCSDSAVVKKYSSISPSSLSIGIS